MKLLVLLAVLVFSSLSMASVRREFFVRNGSLLLTLDIPNNPRGDHLPIIVQITDPATHQLVEIFNTSVEVIYWMPGDKNIQSTDDMDRCDEQVAGRYCSQLKFFSPGVWNINVNYKEFRGDKESQTFMFEVK